MLTTVPKKQKGEKEIDFFDREIAGNLMEITSAARCGVSPPGNEYSMGTASSANMYHDRGEAGSSHCCKLVLSSAWIIIIIIIFWLIKKFPLRSSKEFSSAARARMCPAEQPPNLLFSYGFSVCAVGGSVPCKPRKSLVEIYFF